MYLGAFGDCEVSNEKNFSEGEKVRVGCSKESKVPVDLEVGLECGECVKGGVSLDLEDSDLDDGIEVTFGVVTG